MRIPEAGPEEGPKKTRDHFPHWSIAGGERHTAYIAGPTKWIIGHPSDKGSKPCLTWMTKGALPCRFCGLHKEPCQLGYVPVYRASDWKPLCVIVRADERQWLDAVTLHQRVTIARERGDGAPLYIRPCLESEPRYSSTVDYRGYPQEMDHSCLTLWKMPELIAWLLNRVPSDIALSLDAGERPASHSPADPSTSEPGVKPYTAPDPLDGCGDVDASLDRALRRAKQREAERNGQH